MPKEFCVSRKHAHTLADVWHYLKVGEMVLELGDRCKVHCPTSDLICELDFKSKVKNTHANAMVEWVFLSWSSLVLGILLGSSQFRHWKDQTSDQSKSVVWNRRAVDRADLHSSLWQGKSPSMSCIHSFNLIECIRRKRPFSLTLPPPLHSPANMWPPTQIKIPWSLDAYGPLSLMPFSPTTSIKRPIIKQYSKRSNGSGRKNERGNGNLVISLSGLMVLLNLTSMFCKSAPTPYKRSSSNSLYRIDPNNPCDAETKLISTLFTNDQQSPVVVTPVVSPMPVTHLV